MSEVMKVSPVVFSEMQEKAAEGYIAQLINPDGFESFAAWAHETFGCVYGEEYKVEVVCALVRRELPLCVDLFAGLGGWTDGFLAEGYRCVGYDIEAHDYGTGGYPGTLMLRDIRSVHGSECKDADVIVGSSPCQEFSYRAMPWKRAKALGPPMLGMELFKEQFRIQREAIEAAGHYIPMVVENVRGAQRWVGRAKANYGSFYLWGDVGMVDRRVVAIVNGMPLFGHGVQAMPREAKVAGFRFDGSGKSFQTASVESVKGMGLGSVSWHQGKGQRSATDPRNYYSKDPRRKMASAMIAKIPEPLSRYIARAFKP